MRILIILLSISIVFKAQAGIDTIIVCPVHEECKQVTVITDTDEHRFQTPDYERE